MTNDPATIAWGAPSLKLQGLYWFQFCDGMDHQLDKKTNAVQIFDASFLVLVDNCYLIKIKELQDEKKVWQNVDKNRWVIIH